MVKKCNRCGLKNKGDNPRCNACILELSERREKYRCMHKIRKSQCKVCPRILFEGVEFEVVNGEILYLEI